MNSMEHLIEQHVLQYESRLKRFNELLEQQKKIADIQAKQVAKLSPELEAMMGEREKYHSHLEDLRLKTMAHWQEQFIEKSGPMGIWDAVAQQLEKVVESMEKKDKPS